MRICSKCRVKKLKNQFSVNRSNKDGLHSYCKKCMSKYIVTKYNSDPVYAAKRRAHNKKRYHEDPKYRKQLIANVSKRLKCPKIKAKVRKYNRKYCEDHRVERREWRLQRNYGITQAQYNQIFKDQNGVCKICGRVNNKKKILHVDHNHKTGKVRGLLCNRCNTRLSGVGDKIFKQKAEKYLKCWRILAKGY